MAVKGDHGELNRQLMMNFSSTGGGPSKWVAATLPATILYCALASTKLVDPDRAQSLSRNGHRTQLFAGLDGISRVLPDEGISPPRLHGQADVVSLGPIHPRLAARRPSSEGSYRYA